MKTSIFKKITAAVTGIAFIATSVIAPMANAGTKVTIAPPSGIESNWASWHTQSDNFVSMPNLLGFGEDVRFPKSINYTKIAESIW